MTKETILLMAALYAALAFTLAFGFGWSNGANRKPNEPLDLLMAALWPVGLVAAVLLISANMGHRVGRRRRDGPGFEG